MESGTPYSSGVLDPGRIVDGRYRIVAPIRSGGMGSVYQAQDLRLDDCIVALKHMHEPEAQDDHSAVLERRFHEEMKVLSALRHPGIPRVLNFFRQDRSFCLVMDFIPGVNLEPVNKERVPVAEVLDVTEQVLDILVYLHGLETPILHRDIKPANLIKTPNGRIMLVDFGLARPAEEAPSGAQTIVGTIGYAPLEQLQGKADIRSDLYGLGATMQHLLVGTLPQALCLPSIRQVAPYLPPCVADLVDRALAINPEDRFADAASMRAAVQDVRQQLGLKQDPGVDEPLTPPSDTILVVEDDETVRTFIKRVLERELYSVVEAVDGREGLEMALRVRPDLVLSDVSMPGLDGIALCRKLQNHRLTRDIPVLFLSGRTEVCDETEGLEAGAADYINKPIVPARLVARVQAAMRRRR